ncbi:hypothetical protein EVJ58_g4679 [Rhodofomes roseus]|uniref:Uncharacterized protein n=1 Tax=Rhodofomes roseus TaxID=34475 RepID=A0A4Y9YJP4_9APHY|nr:hypothetical protein EVJ58_g4679 [Rhodofomes roseus]
MNPAFEVYAQQLYSRAWGYPLWEPEPSQTQGEVLIGDVGYLRYGGFYRLFNALEISGGDDSPQATGIAPPNLQCFKLASSAIHRKDNAHSDAEIAIASDLDIIRVCAENRYKGEHPLPEDISRFLAEVQPDIEVTEDKLGMLLFDDEATGTYVPEHYDVEQQEGTFNDSAHIVPGEDRGVQSRTSETDPGPEAPFDGGIDDKGMLADKPSILHLPTTSGNERVGGITVLAFSPVGRDVAAGFENNTIVIWSAMTHGLVHQFQHHTGSVSSIAYSPNGNVLVSGGRDGRVIVWDLIAGGMIRSLPGHQGAIERVAYSPNGKLIATAADSFVKLWNAETGELHASTGDHGGIIMMVTFSPDNERFVSTSSDGTARVWSTHTASHICDLRGHEGVIYAVAYSPDGRRLITGADDGTARVWSALLGDEYMVMGEGEGGLVSAATFGEDGKVLHYVGSERVIKTYDSYTADLLHNIDCGDKVAMAPMFSADGRLLAAGGEDHSITVWDMSSRREIIQFSGHTDNINHLAFSRDNRYLASASDDGSARKWTLPTLAAPI